MAAEYRLFKRNKQLNKKTVYYARIFDSTGTLVQTVSTGKSNQYQAHDWIKEYLIEHDPTKEDPTLREYAEDFFIWGKCEWIARQNAKDRSFVESTARDRRHHLEHYLFPKFGDLKLRDIKAPEVEKYILKLKGVQKKKDGPRKDLSNSTKNQIIYTLNIVLKEAKRDGYVSSIPEIEPFGKKRKKHRVPLSDLEIGKLFPTDRKRFLEIWDDFQIGVLCETILSTGARSGEARGWWKSDILINAKAIKIFRQLYRDGTYGLPGRQRNPDTDPRRIVLLADRTLKDILEIIGNPPYSDDLIFTFEGKAISQNYLLKRLKRAVHRAGIEKDIDVHTLRYTYTSKMRELMISADVPDSVLQKLLGHQSPTVTDIYDPFHIERAIKKAIPSRPAIDEFWKEEKTA